MMSRSLVVLVGAIALLLARPVLAQGCRAMDASAVGVDAGATQLLPERCDESGQCRIFDMSGRQVGATGDFVVPGAASAEGLAPIHAKASDLEGYLNKAGTIVIPPKFTRAGPFCEGRAAVERVDGRWTYIDHDGNEIGDSWDGAEAFTEGRGLVSIFKGGDKWLHGFVDVAGRLVVPARFEAARLFSDGRAAVIVAGDKWGYIDRDGKIVIEPRFAEAELFHAGRAVVRTSAGWTKNAGLIDETGAFLFKERYEAINKVGDVDVWGVGGTDPAFHGDGDPPLLSRLVDRNGRFLSPNAYNSFRGAGEGLINVCRRDKCGFIDPQGKTVIPLQFAYADDFQEHLAAASPAGDRYGFIDRTGKLVIEPRYDSLGPNGEHFAAGPFVDGLAPAGCKGHWGFIDKQGAWAILPVYRLAEAFENGFAAVQIKTGTGHVRRDGTAIDFEPSEVDKADFPEPPCGAPSAKSPPQ